MQNFVIENLLIIWSAKEAGHVQSLTLFARFSKQNYYEKIDKNQRKNIKITKIDRQSG